jgi:predicted nucleic-acid-binding Zn-ribbon protein
MKLFYYKPDLKPLLSPLRNQNRFSMNDGFCPKCQSSHIYRSVSEEGEGLTAGSYLALVEVMAGKTQATLRVSTYICTTCGYIELYIANRADLEVLQTAEGWQKVMNKRK